MTFELKLVKRIYQITMSSRKLLHIPRLWDQGLYNRLLYFNFNQLCNLKNHIKYQTALTVIIGQPADGVNKPKHVEW